MEWPLYLLLHIIRKKMRSKTWFIYLFILQAVLQIFLTIIECVYNKYYAFFSAFRRNHLNNVNFIIKLDFSV